MRKVIKICLWTIAVVMIVCLALMLICNQIVVNNAEGKVFSDIDSIKYNKVGLLLLPFPFVTVTCYKNLYASSVGLACSKSEKIS